MTESFERRCAVPCESLRASKVVLDLRAFKVPNKRQGAHIKAGAFAEVLCLGSSLGSMNQVGARRSGHLTGERQSKKTE